MNQDQKSLYRQAQLAGLGLVIAAVGLLAGHPYLPWIGAGIFAFGLFRLFLIRALIRQAASFQEDPGGDSDPDKEQILEHDAE